MGQNLPCTEAHIAAVAARRELRCWDMGKLMKASLIFPKGRLAVRRRLLSTSYRPPNLATCWFKIRQHGTFSVFYATGKYRRLRYGGQFWTHIAGRLKRTGPDQCGSKIAYYRSVTYEIGKIP